MAHRISWELPSPNQGIHDMRLARPQAIYRQNLLSEVSTLTPRRILEVGCGGGGFLRAATAIGAELHGIDPVPELINELRCEGFSVEVGSAERLSYCDDSFDIVVFCFTAHHIEWWHMALQEALRVAPAVLVLDPWYEIGIPSQNVAARFDQWCKEIDRRSGMIHNDCMSIETLLHPLRDQLSRFNVSVQYMLKLHELGAERMLEIASEQLSKVAPLADTDLQLDALLIEAAEKGFSDDGAILLSVSRHCR